MVHCKGFRTSEKMLPKKDVPLLLQAHLAMGNVNICLNRLIDSVFCGVN